MALESITLCMGALKVLCALTVLPLPANSDISAKNFQSGKPISMVKRVRTASTFKKWVLRQEPVLPGALGHWCVLGHALTKKYVYMKSEL